MIRYQSILRQNIKTGIKIPVYTNFIELSRVYTEIGTLSLHLLLGYLSPVEYEKKFHILTLYKFFWRIPLLFII